MFLIEYRKDCFVDAKKLSILYKLEGDLLFELVGESGTDYSVDEEYVRGFLNHLQAINNGISSVEVLAQ